MLTLSAEIDLKLRSSFNYHILKSIRVFVSTVGTEELKIGSSMLLKGMHIIAVTGNVSRINGANLKANFSTKLCSMSSLERSLIKSAKGWRSPHQSVCIGPYRL